MTRELDLSKGIWSVALVEATFSGRSSYNAVADPHQFVLMRKLEELAKLPEKMRIVRVYDYTDGKGFDEVYEASGAMNRGEKVDLDRVCPYREIAPRVWEHIVAEFNKRHFTKT